MIMSSEELLKNGEVHRALVMEIKGWNLTDLMNTMPNKKFDLATSLHIFH